MSTFDSASNASAEPSPGVVFAMRYPDDVGYVWNTIGQIYDAAAGNLQGRARCFSTFPQLTSSAAFRPTFLVPREVDFYSKAPQDRAGIEAFVKANRIKTVVYMTCDPASIDLPWLRGLGVRTVCYEHDSYPANAAQPWWKHLAKRVVRQGLKHNLHDLYLANAEHQREFLLDFAALPQRRVVTIVNGVDTQRFSPAPADAAALNLPTTDHYAVSISQSRPEKRIPFLIDAAAEVFRRKPDLSLTFVHVGAGPTFEADKAKAAALGLADRYIFVGRRNDTLPYHRLASFLIHAAERESFGLVLAEAMACGKPVIATTSPGPKEIIDPGVTGVLVGEEDLDAFATAIGKLAADEALRRRMGDAARRRAESRYSLQRQAEELTATLAARGFV